MRRTVAACTPGLLLQELYECERTASLPALREAIRLISSSSFDLLTARDIHEVANYRSIEVGDEVFFEKAFSPGKEAAASLAIAVSLGRDEVLGDLRRLERVVAAKPREARRE